MPYRYASFPLDNHSAPALVHSMLFHHDATCPEFSLCHFPEFGAWPRAGDLTTPVSSRVKGSTLLLPCDFQQPCVIVKKKKNCGLCPGNKAKVFWHVCLLLALRSVLVNIYLSAQNMLMLSSEELNRSTFYLSCSTFG